jgi:hypothetical protein
MTAADFNEYFKRKKVKAKVSEHDIQSEFVKEFRSKYPEYVNLLHLINNEPDLVKYVKNTGKYFFAKSNGIKNGMFIEFKAGSNKTTENQEKVIKDLQKFGFYVFIAYSCSEAINEIDNYLNMRA